MGAIFRAGLVFLATVLFAAGCGSAGPRPVKVTGTVLLDDKPMSDGTIYFQADDGRVPTLTTIKDGRYTLEVLPGEWRVLIHQYRDSGKKNVYGDPQMMTTIPPRYNTNTELKASVTPEGGNVINFEIHSQ